jgi:large subunit ribosomal protein L23
MEDARDIIIRPIITEKSMDGLENSQYTFEVNPKANKYQIKQAVKEIFNVEVASVNTLKVQGKLKRRGVHVGRTSERKKAIVTLKPGQRIEFFEGM